MRRHPFAAIAALGLLAASVGSTVVSVGQDLLRSDAPSQRPSRKKEARKRMIAGGYKPKRSRGAQAARKGKTNRNHISKRVRRKHRRSTR